MIKMKRKKFDLMDFNMDTTFNEMTRPKHLFGEKKNKKKDYKLDEIAPTSESMKINPFNQSHPNTLPFISPEKKEIQQQFEELTSIENIKDELMGIDINSEERYKYPTERKVTTSIAASLFHSDEENKYEGNGQLFFLQFPTQLPLTLTEEENKKDKDFSENLSKLPEGRIGRLFIFKSGKVKLCIGEITYDVSQGMPCNFLQELVAIDHEKKKFYQLGEVTNRMVAYPDISMILKKKDQKKKL